jgi:hypothetical protein
MQKTGVMEEGVMACVKVEFGYRNLEKPRKT